LAAVDDLDEEAIVQAIPVNVMHDLIRGQAMTASLFHHPPVECDLPPINTHVPVATLNPPDPSSTAIVTSNVPTRLSAGGNVCFSAAPTGTARYVVHHPLWVRRTSINVKVQV
jgi:hypothetical protein